MNESHKIGMDLPTVDNDPVGRFRAPAPETVDEVVLETISFLRSVEWSDRASEEQAADLWQRLEAVPRTEAAPPAPDLREAMRTVVARMEVSLGQYVCHEEFDRATRKWRDELSALLDPPGGTR